MSLNIFRHFHRRRYSSLVKQWEELGDLPSKKVKPGHKVERHSAQPDAATAEKPAGEGVADTASGAGEPAQEKTPEAIMLPNTRGTIRLPVRYFILMVVTIGLLLVAFAVVLTILIIRS